MNNDYYAYCANVPDELREMLNSAREADCKSPRQVYLNPIPTAIAGISAEEWKASVSKCEAAILLDAVRVDYIGQFFRGERRQ